MDNIFYHSGCSIQRYKPELVNRVLTFLQTGNKGITRHGRCCRVSLQMPLPAVVITTCPGCEYRFFAHPDISTITLWEYLAESDFPFPDYKGMEMAIHDSCTTCKNTAMHNAVRTTLRRMNITAIEPDKTRTEAECCRPVSETGQMLRADAMPRNDVVVYCAGCMSSMFQGGKSPHHMLDLMFSEQTVRP